MGDGRRCRIVAVYASVGDGVYGVRRRKGRGLFGCDIGIEYGFRIVVVIELEKRVRVERKEEGYRGMGKNIFCKSDKKIFA